MSAHPKAPAGTESRMEGAVARTLGKKKPKKAQKAGEQEKLQAQQAQARRRAAVKQSMRTKAQFDSLTLRWQEKLLGPVSEAILKQAARYLTPDDYDSIVSERASGDLCAYPLCSNKAKQMTQTFHISLTRRKLFDIGEQASYCSSRCLVGSRFYKQQLPEDPVYLRDRKSELHIEVVPLAGDKGSSALPARAAHPGTPSTHGSGDKELTRWYTESLLAKMKIPDSVAAANPLQIVEHDTGKAEFDISESAGKLQFADIEGFEPEVDSLRIRRAVKHAARAASKHKDSRAENKRAHGKKEAAAAKEMARKDAEAVVVTVGSKGLNAYEMLQPEDSLSTDLSDQESLPSSSDDNSTDDSDGSGEEGECSYFTNVYSQDGTSGRAHCSHAGPSMSLFGRMWTMVDWMATEQTREYLSDLKISQSADALLGSANDYHVAPGDKSMAMRHSLLLDSITRELFEIQGVLHMDLMLDHETRLLISTLALNGSMVVFNKPELQLLCLTLLLALARSIESLSQELDSVEVSQRLDGILRGLRVEKSELGMISRRFHEAY